MPENKTANQVRDEYLQALGPILGPLYYGLYNEVAWLHAKWNQYRMLFDSEERVQLLNDVAGFFFRVIQRVLWDDIVLHIARLTDPQRSGGKNTLTLLRLTGALESPTLVDQIKDLVGQARKDAEIAKEWRNRHLAHRELDLALGGRAATPLPGISRENIEQALHSIRAVLNKIEGHFSRSEVAFTQFIASGDAESLAYYLKFAIDAENRLQERQFRARNP